MWHSPEKIMIQKTISLKLSRWFCFADNFSFAPKIECFLVLAVSAFCFWEYVWNFSKNKKWKILVKRKINTFFKAKLTLFSNENKKISEMHVLKAKFISRLMQHMQQHFTSPPFSKKTASFFFNSQRLIYQQTGKKNSVCSTGASTFQPFRSISPIFRPFFFRRNSNWDFLWLSFKKKNYVCVLFGISSEMKCLTALLCN